MTGVPEHFTDLFESGLDVEVVLGDDTIVRAIGQGTITFQRESREFMTVRDVLYVLRLKKNLILVSAIDDRGFEVLFQDGHVLIHPKDSSETTTSVIGVRCGKLYKLTF